MGDNIEFKNIKILLAEDDDYSALVAQEILSHWGAEVDLVADGQQAVDKTRSAMFDIILMDIQMPVMDGYIATSKIREFNTQIPIIALTASSDTSLQDMLETKGFTTYLIKPYNPLDLHDILCKYGKDLSCK